MDQRVRPLRAWVSLVGATLAAAFTATAAEPPTNPAPGMPTTPHAADLHDPAKEPADVR